MKSVHLQVSSFEDNKQPLGPRMTPGKLPQLDSLKIIPSVTSAINQNVLYDKQPFMWIEGVGIGNITDPAEVAAGEPTNLGNPTNEIFFSDFPTGTDTGVLRALALRFNSSVDCKIVPSSDFPSTCPGENPLNRTYSNVDESASEPFGNLREPKFEARLCAPGDVNSSPWNDTGARQDITEEFRLDFRATNLTDRIENFTLACNSETSLGFFELPNYWNGHVLDPLLSHLPPQHAPNQTYYTSSYPPPSTEPDHGPTRPVPGPFLTAMLAIFGNGSFFDTVASHSSYSDSSGLLCDQLRQPFANLGISYDSLWQNALFNASNKRVRSSSPVCESIPNQVSNDSLLLYALLNWLPNFSNADISNAAFLLATYSASTAMFNPSNWPVGDDEFMIFSSPGLSIQKPVVSLPAIIVISILIALQLIGLTWLAFISSRRSTWTPSLNAFALLRMGAALHKDLPLISATQATELAVLDDIPGWIGSDSRGEGAGKLVIGGPEEIVPRRKYRMVENEGEWTMDDKEIGTWKRLFCGGFTDAQMRSHECSLRRRSVGDL